MEVVHKSIDAVRRFCTINATEFFCTLTNFLARSFELKPVRLVLWDERSKKERDHGYEEACRAGGRKCGGTR